METEVQKQLSALADAVETREQRNQRIRALRLDREWDLLQKQVLAGGPVRAVERIGDKFHCLVTRPSKNDTMVIVFSNFPADYPLHPPCWKVDGINEEFCRSEHDPWQGAYGPSITLSLWIDRLVEMTGRSAQLKC